MASTVTTYAACRRAFDGDRARAALVALGVAVSSMLVMHFGHWGQREHLFVLGFVPVRGHPCRTGDPQPFSVVPAACIGVIAAIAASIKPHFAAISLLADAFLLPRRDHRDSCVRRSSSHLSRPDLPTHCTSCSSQCDARRVVWPLDSVHCLRVPRLRRADSLADSLRSHVLGAATCSWDACFSSSKPHRPNPVCPRYGDCGTGRTRPRTHPAKRWGTTGHSCGSGRCVDARALTYDLVEPILRRVSGPQRRGIQILAMAALVLVIAVELTLAAFGGAFTQTAARGSRVVRRAAAGDRHLQQARRAGVRHGDDRHYRVSCPRAVGAHPAAGSCSTRSRCLVSRRYRGSGQPYPYQLPPGELRDAEARYRREMQEDIQTRRPSIILVGRGRARRVRSASTSTTTSPAAGFCTMR